MIDYDFGVVTLTMSDTMWHSLTAVVQWCIIEVKGVIGVQTSAEHEPPNVTAYDVPTTVHERLKSKQSTRVVRVKKNMGKDAFQNKDSARQRVCYRS